MDKDFIKSQLLAISESADIEYVDKYINFCISNHEPDIVFGENHHILSAKLFPEYKNFKENSWNLSRLSNYNHYIAHAILFKSINNVTFGFAWYAMNNKNFILEEDKPIELIGPELFEELRLKRNKLCSEINSGKVSAKDLSTGKNIRVTQEEFYSNNNLVGHTTGFGGDHLKGSISVRDENGLVTRILKSEFNESIHDAFNKGMVVVKDNNDNTSMISNNDPRYLSGELTAINKGRKFGEEFGRKISESIKLSGHLIGSRNPTANLIVIFDDKDEAQYFSHGNYNQMCKENNLSEQLFARTYTHNTKIYDYVDDEFIEKSRKCDITKLFNTSLYKNYKGWYARKMERIKI